MVANSLSQLRPNGVIPVPMKLVALQIDSLHFLIRHLRARRVFPPVQAAGHLQTLRGGRPSTQAHNRLVIPQRLAAPVRRDEREQAVFDMVPSAVALPRATRGF